MGKQRRQRQKLHLTTSPSKAKQPAMPDDFTPLDTNPITLTPNDDLFANIDFSSLTLNKKLNNDTRSVKSFKSVKSDVSGDKALSKKEKLKLRREYLLKKIDTVKQMKKEAKLRAKRKKTAVLGDTNPLHDALPSLESLLQSREVKRVPAVAKPKAIQKAVKRKKSYLTGIDTFKKVLSNKDFKKNPLAAITEHVKAIAEMDKANNVKEKPKKK